MSQMTATQKILADHAGCEQVTAGEIITCRLDLAMANDVTAVPAIEEFKKLNTHQLWDKNKIVFVADHFTPNRDIKSAQMNKKLLDFVKENDLPHFYDLGRGGIEHIILPEKGLVCAGQLVIGADSHTCTYGALGAFSAGVGSSDLAVALATGEVWLKVPSAIKINLSGQLAPFVSGKDLILQIIGVLGVDGASYQSLEYAGQGVAALTMADRLTVCNMSVECGAKNGIFPVDKQTVDFMKQAGVSAYKAYAADEDAQYTNEYEFDLSQIPVTVAAPYLPSNIKRAEELSNVTLDQVVIGSCTNGRIEDFRVAAKLIKGRKIAPYLRCLVMPGSQLVYRQMLAEGLADIFVESGSTLTMPTCGPCIGGHCGILAAGEKALATTNRNFIGRMGHKESQIYLAGAACAAASAVMGRIAHPSELKEAGL